MISSNKWFATAADQSLSLHRQLQFFLSVSVERGKQSLPGLSVVSILVMLWSQYLGEKEVYLSVGNLSACLRNQALEKKAYKKGTFLEQGKKMDRTKKELRSKAEASFIWGEAEGDWICSVWWRRSSRASYPLCMNTQWVRV